MKMNLKNTVLVTALCILFATCAHPNENSLKDTFAKDKALVTFTYFFDTKPNSEVENLDIKLEVVPPKSLNLPLEQDKCVIKYDAEGEKKTSESLEMYLNELKNYTRYIYDFSFDSIECKVYATDKFDITHIIMLNKYNNKYHFIHESFFVYGTILKVTETEIKSNEGDFDDITTEKTTISLFDENKLFLRTEEKFKKPVKSLKFNSGDAFRTMEDAFLLRQFCRDALLKLKDSQPDWFK